VFAASAFSVVTRLEIEEKLAVDNIEELVIGIAAVLGHPGFHRATRTRRVDRLRNIAPTAPAGAPYHGRLSVSMLRTM
jgi:hypothetical protein